MQIDGNTIIKCKSQTEVSTCLNMLNDLGFETFYEENDCKLLVAATFITLKLYYLFTSFETREISSKNNLISFKTFQKLYNKQIEKNKQPKLLVDKNGKILKVNDFKDKAVVYYTNLEDLSIVEEGISCKDLKNKLYNKDYFISEEACEKALKRKEIENKLQLLAFELNGNRNITEKEWKNIYIDKYYLYYLLSNKIIDLGFNIKSKDQGTIFCLSEDFKDKAIELIGEKDLKEYLINC